MRRALLLLGLLVTGPLYPQSSPGANENEFLADLSLFYSLGAVAEGSAEETRLFDRARERLAGFGVWQEFELQGRDYHSFGRLALWTRPGTGQGRMTLVVPANGEDRAWSWAQALWWARDWGQQATGWTLELAFVGAEGAFESPSVGYRRLLEVLPPSLHRAAVVWDWRGPPGTGQLRLEAAQLVSPIWMVLAAQAGFARKDWPLELKGHHPRLWRPEGGLEPNPLDVWFAADVPALWIRNNQSPGDQVSLLPRTNPDSYGFWQAFVENHPEGPPGTWDRHYLALQIGPWVWIWNQSAYLAALLAVAALLMLVPFLRTRGFTADLRLLWRDGLQLPLLALMYLFCLWSATALGDALALGRDWEELWREAPLALLGLKVTGALFLYSLFLYQTPRWPLSRYSGFYRLGAQAASLLLGLTAASAGLAYSFPFFWTLLMTWLSLFSPWRPLRLLWLLLSPLWFIWGAWQAFFVYEEPVLIRLLLTSPLEGNLIIVAYTFPTLLLASAYHFETHQRLDTDERLRGTLIGGAWGLSALGVLAFLATWDPFGPERPAQLTWEESWSEEARDLRLFSPRPWPEASFSLPGAELPLPAGFRQLEAGLPSGQAPARFSARDRAFLDRRSWVLSWDLEGQPESLHLELTGSEDWSILSANFPYTVVPGENRARFFIGRQPPSRGQLELVLSRRPSHSLHWSVAWADLPYPISPPPPGWVLAPRLEAQGSLELPGGP